MLGTTVIGFVGGCCLLVLVVLKIRSESIRRGYVQQVDESVNQNSEQTVNQTNEGNAVSQQPQQTVQQINQNTPPQLYPVF